MNLKRREQQYVCLCVFCVPSIDQCLYSSLKIKQQKTRSSTASSTSSSSEANVTTQSTHYGIVFWLSALTSYDSKQLNISIRFPFSLSLAHLLDCLPIFFTTFTKITHYTHTTSHCLQFSFTLPIAISNLCKWTSNNLHPQLLHRFSPSTFPSIYHFFLGAILFSTSSLLNEDVEHFCIYNFKPFTVM